MLTRHPMLTPCSSLARPAGSKHVNPLITQTSRSPISSFGEAELSNISERTLAGLTIRIERDLCVGFGDCMDVAPDTFEFDDEGIAVFRTGDPAVDREVLLDACSSCPVDVLTALDEEGAQLVP